MKTTNLIDQYTNEILELESVEDKDYPKLIQLCKELANGYMINYRYFDSGNSKYYLYWANFYDEKCQKYQQLYYGTNNV